MDEHPVELIAAARCLIEHPGCRPAWVRRSISTCYYALFHFLLKEVSRRIVGDGPAFSWQRHVLARTVTHAGLSLAIEKMKYSTIDVSVANVFGPPGQVTPVPSFARAMATTFLDAKAKRTTADYDLNVQLSTTDAEGLIARVEREMVDWQGSVTESDEACKKGFALLAVMGGRARRDI